MTRNRLGSQELKNLESTVDAIDQLIWGETGRVDLVGLEIEAFPFVRDSCPFRRHQRCPLRRAARSQAIELMPPITGQLDLVWQQFARSGLRAPEMAATAGKLVRLALDAAGRSEHIDQTAVAIASEFIDRITFRGLSPGDELRSLRAEHEEMLDPARLVSIWERNR